MDRNWMKAKRITSEYENGVEQFLKFAERYAPHKGGKYFCPCVKCLNGRRHGLDDIRTHLICEGIVQNYTKWIWHGEVTNNPSVSQVEPVDVEMGDRLEEMIRTVGQESFRQAHEPLYESLESDLKKPLYPGCKKETRLSAVLHLVNLKARHGWSDKSFTDLLGLLQDMLPKNNTLPKNYYEAKKVLCPMGMEYEKIHACPNDCVLYRHDYAEMVNCPKCGLSRYKMKDDKCTNDEITNKKPPAKVCWYLPIISRFKRLFANEDDAKNLTWHADGRKVDGLLRHPADSPQWKSINQLYPQFGEEPRNLRLGLATDGMNPFGNLSTNHSSWPVLLMIYNLPPWLCMKRKYMMLSMMISGPRQPGNDIDVYLTPLIEDLRKLWDEGVDVFDGNCKQIFKLRVLLFCTINDFPAYGNLSGYSVKGHHACPICEEDTSYVQLKHGKKIVYTSHRRFLKADHSYRRLKKAFNGRQEFGIAPTPLTGKQVYERVEHIDCIFGKTQKNDATEKSKWKKRSIFFDLPYWSDLDVRHCIDVMHVEKNVCDSLIGTLLNIKGKTKDGLNARKDLVDMGIREEMHPRSDGNRTYLPPACHTLSRQEKTSLCQCLAGVKVPQGYSSNFKSLVSLKELKLVGLKSHDCHVLMQQLLAVAIQNVLPEKVRVAITRLCFFFNAICSKVIDPQKLDELENEAAIILCQLEMYFPPSFFDIMLHLIVHLVREIRLCGPVYLRWMYPVERYMKILKGYTKNPYRPEASIVQRYIAEETIEFCTEYLEKAQPVGLPVSRHDDRLTGKGSRGLVCVTIGLEELNKAHLYILNNTAEVLPYIDVHKQFLKVSYPKMTKHWLSNEHNKRFIKWFKHRIFGDDNASGTLKKLANGPNRNVLTWKGYDINNYTFYTKSQDDKSTVQNSGVSVEAESEHFSSSKDNNPLMASMPYFGVIEQIWELDYIAFKVPIFKCKWVNTNTGLEVDHMGFTLVDLNRLGYKDDPFIMAVQAKQVFYVQHPSNSRWSVVLQGRISSVSNFNDESTLDICHCGSFSTRMPLMNEEQEVDVVHANRIDHNEGLWENIPT